jgi:hypothetical protein
MNVWTNVIFKHSFVLLNSCKQTTLFTFQGFHEDTDLIMRFPKIITLENAALTQSGWNWRQKSVRVSHTMYLGVSYVYQNKQRMSPTTAVTNDLCEG